MRFYPNQLFHIYNQGNNRRQIFFSDENYRFFLWKMRGYLTPFGDFIAYVLMPNHYHWLFYVRKIEIQRKEYRAKIDNVEFMRRIKKYGNKAQDVDNSSKRRVAGDEKVELRFAIGDLQMAYTKAINREKDMSGSLFRKKFQSKDSWIDEFISLENKNGRTDSRFGLGNDYGYNCLQYIHENPKKAGLVVKSEDWEFSSAKEYKGLRNGSLCNLKLGKELIKYI
jgi:putative transposase